MIIFYITSEFQKRVARWMMGGGEDDSQDTSPAPETQRQVLSQLKATGKRHTVPVNRTGTAVQGKYKSLKFSSFIGAKQLRSVLKPSTRIQNYRISLEWPWNFAKYTVKSLQSSSNLF